MEEITEPYLHIITEEVFQKIILEGTAYQSFDLINKRSQEEDKLNLRILIKQLMLVSKTLYHRLIYLRNNLITKSIYIKDIEYPKCDVAINFPLPEINIQTKKHPTIKSHLITCNFKHGIWGIINNHVFIYKNPNYKIPYEIKRKYLGKNDLLLTFKSKNEVYNMDILLDNSWIQPFRPGTKMTANNLLMSKNNKIVYEKESLKYYFMQADKEKLKGEIMNKFAWSGENLTAEGQRLVENGQTLSYDFIDGFIKELLKGSNFGNVYGLMSFYKSFGNSRIWFESYSSGRKKILLVESIAIDVLITWYDNYQNNLEYHYQNKILKKYNTIDELVLLIDPNEISMFADKSNYKDNQLVIETSFGDSYRILF